jgi:hypothetical protein
LRGTKTSIYNEVQSRELILPAAKIEFNEEINGNIQIRSKLQFIKALFIIILEDGKKLYKDEQLTYLKLFQLHS